MKLVPRQNRETTVPVQRPNLLIVEGQDEKRFFTSLLEHLQITDVEIRPIGGKHVLRRELRLLTSPLPGFENVRSLGIVRDADTDPAAAFRSICQALNEVGLAVPERCLEPSGSRPRVAAMVLPSEGVPGSLETLCVEAVRDDKAMPCVEGYFDCLKKQGFPESCDDPKARTRVFIASRGMDARLLGEAAEAGVWPWGSPAFDEAKGFLKTLFG